jgi:hypothetical protein
MRYIPKSIALPAVAADTRTAKQTRQPQTDTIGEA